MTSTMSSSLPSPQNMVSQHTAINMAAPGNKSEYTPRWKCTNWAQIAFFSLPAVMWLVSVTRCQVWMGNTCVKCGVITLSYWSVEVQFGASWQITLRGSEKKNCCSTKRHISKPSTLNQSTSRHLHNWLLATCQEPRCRWRLCFGE